MNLPNNSLSKKILVPISIIVIIMAISIVVFFQYFGFNNNFFSIYYFSDLLRANLPTYTLLYDYIASGNFHLWSWEMGLGTTLLSHADVIFDPFTYITFIFGRDNISHMMLWSLIIKIIFEGLSFALYLNYFKLDKKAIIIASIAYAFCGYSLIMGNNLALGTILVYMPLLLLGIELMLNERRPYVLLISILLIGLLSYYYLFMAGIIAVLYTMYRIDFNVKKMVRPISSLLVCAIIAMLIISPVLLPQLEMALYSPRSITKDVVFSIDLFMPNIDLISKCILRSFSPDLLGESTNYLSSDYFSGEWFIPMIAIPLISYFIIETRNKKIIWSVIIIVFLSSIPFVSWVFNCFSTINYRWMFIFHILGCLLCAFSINHMIKNGLSTKTMQISLLISALILFISMIIFGFFNKISLSTIVERGLLPLSMILITYLLLLIGCLLLSKKINNKTITTDVKYYGKTIFTLLLIILICFSVVGYHDWYGDDNPSAKFDNGSTNGYNGWDQDIINEIKENDQTSFYRVYKEFDAVYDSNNIASDNDSMVQSYYGLKCYNSMNNANFVEFLQTLGIYVCVPVDTAYYKSQGIDPKTITGQQLNFINGIDDKKDMLSYLGVKYYVVKTNQMVDVPANFELIETYHDMAVYINKTYNGLGFVNSSYMSYSEFMNKTFDERVNIIQNHTILEDTSGMIETGIKSQCELKYFDGDCAKFNVNIAGGEQYVSFSIPYDPYWTVIVDGKEVSSEKINISLLGVKVSEGEHTIELRYTNDLMNNCFTVSFATVIALLLLIAFKDVLLNYKTKKYGLDKQH